MDLLNQSLGCFIIFIVVMRYIIMFIFILNFYTFRIVHIKIVIRLLFFVLWVFCLLIHSKINSYLINHCLICFRYNIHSLIWTQFALENDLVEISLINKFQFANCSVNGAIRCPCPKCHYDRWETRDMVFDHLICKHFLKNYKVWIWHGEMYETLELSEIARNTLKEGVE